MNPARILIVDDEIIIARELEARLTAMGYEVPGIATSGQEAIALAEQVRPDLVLMDIMLKGEMDGIEAAAAICSRHAVPLIYLTAFTDEKTLERAKVTEPFGYIVKPFSERELKANIEMVLYRHQIETELTRARELEQANKELEAFSYSVSHDLHAPLRIIQGFAEILLDRYAPQLPATAQEYLRLIRNATTQMGQLIDDLLAFSRLSRQPLKKQTVALTELVHQALEQLRPEQVGRRVQIQVGELGTCQADPGLLKQVWVNLLANALKFTRTREEAVIEVGRRAGDDPRDDPIFFVKDNGVGFDMEHAGKLFGVFKRLHSAKEYEGTGVGLAIVDRIILRHGGRIWVEAEVDRGATFSFTLGGGVPPNQPTDD